MVRSWIKPRPPAVNFLIHVNPRFKAIPLSAFGFPRAIEGRCPHLFENSIKDHPFFPHSAHWLDWP
jgi:hypothetical protein